MYWCVPAEWSWPFTCWCSFFCRQVPLWFEPSCIRTKELRPRKPPSSCNSEEKQFEINSKIYFVMFVNQYVNCQSKLWAISDSSFDSICHGRRPLLFFCSIVGLETICTLKLCMPCSFLAIIIRFRKSVPFSNRWSALRRQYIWFSDRRRLSWWLATYSRAR